MTSADCRRRRRRRLRKRQDHFNNHVARQQIARGLLYERIGACVTPTCHVHTRRHSSSSLHSISHCRTLTGYGCKHHAVATGDNGQDRAITTEYSSSSSRQVLIHCSPRLVPLSGGFTGASHQLL